MKKVLLGLFIIIMSTMVVGCKNKKDKIDPEEPEQIITPTIIINTNDQKLKIGESVQIDFEIKNYNGEFNWFSTNTDAVTVSDGLATIVGVGVSNVGISFEFEGKEYKKSIQIEGYEEKVLYKVIYKDDKGIVLKEEKVEDVTTVKAPTAPTLSGYAFKKWNLETDEEALQYVYTAVYEITSYVITYIKNDSEVSATMPKTPNKYTIEDEITLPSPTPSTYFLGWYDNKECSGDAITTIEKGTTGNVTLYAKWQPTHYAITYVYDEGKPVENACTSVAEFSEVFFNELYAWSGSTKSFSTFKSEALGAWKSGASYSDAKIYGADLENTVDNRFFVSHEDNYDRWMPWMVEFNNMVHDINSDQTAWESEYVGYLRLYAFLMQSASYWNATRNANLYSKMTKPMVLPTRYNIGVETSIPELFIDDGRTFLGWYDNEACDGTPITKISKDATGDKTLYAKWSPKIVATAFEITKPNRILLLDEEQLTWSFTPTNTSQKDLVFTSSDSSILEITPKGVMVAKKVGKVSVTVEVKSNPELNQTWEVEVYFEAFIDGSYKTSSIVNVGDTIELIAKAYGATGNIEWTSLNPTIATVNEGVVTGVSKGYAEIEAKLEGTEVSFILGVTVSDGATELEIIEAAHNDDIHVTRDLNVAYAYLADVYTSVSDLLYNRPYEINTEFEAVQAANSENHGGARDTTEFICVHYTAGTPKSSTASNTASYMCGTTGDGAVSIHYTTGNDGIYHCLDNSLIAWHAGDGTGVKFQWINTGVEATENVKPVWGVVKNSASSSGYYFTLNGQATTIVVPTTGTTSSGSSKTMTDPSKCFTYFGPAWKIVDGVYYMGTTWACFTQTLDGRISSRGGNRNSIGIETACNMGSDLWLTYQITAQLVAHLLIEYELDLTRVVGHNAFSGKDCPQTLLANDGELWPLFMECVEQEYNKLTTMSDYEVTFTSSNTDLVDNYGRIISIPRYSTSVSYTVTITNKTTHEVTTETFCTIIHGQYTE